MSYKWLKTELRVKYGRKCMLCGRKLKEKQSTFHHIVPKSRGGEATEENGAVLCESCQSIIHLFEYEDEGYQKLTKRILKNKRV